MKAYCNYSIVKSTVAQKDFSHVCQSEGFKLHISSGSTGILSLKISEYRDFNIEKTSICRILEGFWPIIPLNHCIKTYAKTSRGCISVWFTRSIASDPNTKKTTKPSNQWARILKKSPGE